MEVAILVLLLVIGVGIGGAGWIDIVGHEQPHAAGHVLFCLGRRSSSSTTRTASSPLSIVSRPMLSFDDVLRLRRWRWVLLSGIVEVPNHSNPQS